MKKYEEGRKELGRTKYREGRKEYREERKITY